MKRVKLITVALLALASVALRPAPARAQTADPQYLEAKRLFDALDYENALRLLDQAIASLQARPVQDQARHDLLPAALEMRARSKFGLGDQDGAKADFIALLKADAGYMLTGQVSPRVVALFDSIVADTVTRLTLAVTPSTAKIELDGAPVAAAGTIPIAIGDHVLTADQPGYRAVRQMLTAEAGKTAELTLALERVSSMVNILTAPADVDVSIDGVKRGKTTAGPPAAAFADAVARSGAPAGQVSAVMVVTDLQPGAHTVEFTRECYVRSEKKLTIDKPDDFTVGPVALDRAVAIVTARSSEPGAQVFVDGQPRGVSPFEGELCEGDHTIELRTPAGRYVKRLQAKTGDRVTVEGAIRPAVALVAVTGQPAGSPDLRMLVERALDPSRAATFFAPPADAAAQALRANQLPPGWLAFDANKRAVTTAADAVQAQRGDTSSKLAGLFGAQGVGSLSVVDRNQVVLAVLAAGSNQPDVLVMSLDNPQSITDALAQLDRLPAFSKPSVGVSLIDVADVQGAVVVGVDAGSAAASALAAGDVVKKANGEAVVSAVAFDKLLASKKAGDELMIEGTDQSGAAKQAALKVTMTPRLVGISDQTLLANRVLLALRARLLGPVDPSDEPIVRLNLAAALAHVEAWSDARAELQKIRLPDGPGVSNGTVQYLLGVCEDKLGNRSAAEAAWKAAAASNSLLTEDGPAVKELAEARLADLQRPAVR